MYAMRTKKIVAGHENGIVVVEFAISMALILFLMMVVAELGRLYYSYTILNQSVRTGARYLSNNALSSSLALDIASAQAATESITISGNTEGGTSVLPGYSADDLSITSLYPSGIGKPYIRVAAAYNYIPIFTAIPVFWSGDTLNYQIVLNAENTMRAFR